MDRSNCRIDLSHPRHEHQDITRLAGVDDSFDGVRRLVRDLPLIMMAQVTHLDRKALPFRNENWTGGRCKGRESSVEGRRVLFAFRTPHSALRTSLVPLPFCTLH